MAALISAAEGGVEVGAGAVECVRLRDRATEHGAGAAHQQQGRKPDAGENTKAPRPPVKATCESHVKAAY